ncbi:MAG: hypothetical protein HY553_14745 [Elusimicrobia bacterium]|nr:hypothetical protein [Elusimicrobiota bacterium]
MPVNTRVLRIFGPVLLAAGALGFAIPPEHALFSGAPWYNVFHIAFGLAATAIAFRGSDGGAAAFNAAFGAIDLYQAVASRLAWFPAAQFRWTRWDDAAHVLLGLALVAVGLSRRR